MSMCESDEYGSEDYELHQCQRLRFDCYCVRALRWVPGNSHKFRPSMIVEMPHAV
jgi:hypothetical protein